MPDLSRETRRALVRELLALPGSDGPAVRAAWLLDWPERLRHSITLTGTPSIDVTTLVVEAARWEPVDGTPGPLITLIENAQEQVRGTAAAARLGSLLTTAAHELAGTVPPLAPTLTPTLAPPADFSAQFANIRSAYEAGDMGRVLDLARFLPVDYPGLAPLVARARAAIDGLAAAWADGQWVEVVRQAAALPHLPPDVLPMVEEARQKLALAPLHPARPAITIVIPLGGVALVGLGLTALLAWQAALNGPHTGPSSVNFNDPQLAAGIVAVLGGIMLAGLGPHGVAAWLARQRHPRRAALVPLLHAMPSLTDRAARDLLLLDLPPAVVAAIPRTLDPAADLSAIVQALDGWGTLDEGTPALLPLLENALELTPPERVATRLKLMLAELRTAPPAPPDLAARFQALTAAYARGDWRAVRLIATALPPDYPGLEPLRARAERV